jgi:hypothetical protein
MRKLAFTLVTTVVATLVAAAATAYACTKHGLASPAPHTTAVPTSLDLLFAPRPKVRGLSLLANINPGGGHHGDVWAHRGFAYLSSWRGDDCPASGVRVIDLSRPSRPQHVATFADAAREPEIRGTWTEKTIVREARSASFRGTIAVTSMQHCDERAFRGFGLYDLTDPRSPKRLALVRTEGVRGSHEIWLENARGRVWVYTAIVRSELLSSPDYDAKARTARTPGLADFRIFDVTDPRKPVQVGSWGSWKELGIHPNDGRGVYPANLVHSVITDDAAKRAYLSNWDLGTVILDISRPAAPRYLGRTRLPASEPQGDAHSTALARNGTLLIETHETVLGRPTFFDIANPRRPKRVGTLRLPEADAAPKPHNPYYAHSVHDPKVLGDHAFFSWYRHGIVVADISRPARPKVVARFVPPGTADPTGDTCGRGSGGSCAFVWGVFATQAYVLASDMNSGLWVLRLNRGR